MRPAAVTDADFDCSPAAPMREFFPDNLWLDTLNFHLPDPRIDSTPDEDFFRIQIPDVQESCDAPCPAILSGKFDPAALTILIESDRDRPVMVTVTNFTTHFVLDNDPTTAAPAASEIDGRKFEISRIGNQTLIQLECPRGSGVFPDGMVGLALSDPDGQRNFYNLRASYQAIASCDIDKLLVNPGMMELILGRLWGAVDPPPDIRFLPMMTVADPANAATTRGQSMPFMDEPADNGAWSGQDRWLVLLPRGQTSMDISVAAPPGADAFDVGIELRNLHDQPIAQAVEVGNGLNNTPGAAAAALRAPASSVRDDLPGNSSPRRYRLETQQLEGCFYILKITRPQPGGRFGFEATFTKTPEIRVTPVAVAFGNRCRGTLSEPQWVSVDNTGAAGLVISDLSLAGPDAAEFLLVNAPAFPAEIAPGTGLSFGVSFLPADPGARTADVVISSNDATDPVVRLPVAGTGQEGDLAPPQLNCPPDITVWTCANSAPVQYAVTASDDCDPTLKVVCLPPSGSAFGLGTTVVRCTVTDDSGKPAECTFSVTVLSDTEPPAIQCPESRVVNSMGPNGALVFYEVTATDNGGAAVTLDCSPPSGSWFPPGETLVTCEAVDTCGNRAQCTFPVTVSQPPDIHYFVDTFDGPDWHPAWEAPGNAFSLVNGEAAPNGPRGYVRTGASDYRALDFEAELIYWMNGGDGAGGLFFGLGEAILDPGYFNEPLTSVYLLDHTQDFPVYQGTVVRALPASGQPQGFFAWLDDDTQTDGQHALRLIKRGDQLTWEMDHLYDGDLGFKATYSGSITLADVPFLNASNSRLFFGADASPTRIREFRVTRLAPALAVELNDSEVIVSWPLSAGSGWRLESSPHLSPPMPWAALPPPYPTDATHYRVITPASDGTRFYRLRSN